MTSKVRRRSSELVRTLQSPLRVGFLSSFFAGASLLLLGAGCNFGCDDVGCASGTQVRFSNALPAEAKIEYRVPGRSFATTSCLLPDCEVVYLPDVRVDELEVRVRFADRTISESFRPRYREYKAGGGCGPTCFSAELVMDVEELGLSDVWPLGGE